MRPDSAGRARISTRAAVVLGALVLALLASVLTPSAAAAAPGSGAATESGDEPTASSGLSLAGFDSAVARAHGYEVVILPDGSQASVPADKAAAARSGEYVPTSGVLPPGAARNGYAELPGNCGTSWVSFEARGGSGANLSTGMRLTPDAGEPWDVHWQVNITDNGGSSVQRYSEENGFFGFLSWTAYNRRLHLTRGWAFAAVAWHSSYTVTENGWICWSAGPSTTEEIY